MILKVYTFLDVCQISNDFDRLKDPQNSYLAKGIKTSAKYPNAV